MFTPGDQEARIAENVKSGADALFLDIEEPRTPCPEETRVRARGLVREFLDTAPAGPGAPVYFVRVQPVASGMILRDLQAVMGPNLAGHPAAEDHRPGRRARGRRDPHVPRGRARPARRRDDALPDPRERAGDPQRVRDRDGVASASRTWAARCRGSATSSPTSASVGRATGTETLYIREKVLIDARAAGIRYPISGMWGGANDDLDGLRAWLTELRDIGYFGMMMGNAEHVPIVNAAFTPTAEEVAYWQRASTG